MRWHFPYRDVINIYPYLTIHNYQISLYGCFAALGILAALIYVQIYEKKNKVYSADIDISLVYGLIGGVIGSKALYLIVNIKEFVSEIHFAFTETLLFIEKYFCSGFVYFGGVFGFLVALHLYARFVKIPVDEIVRPAIPALSLFHAFGRIGCFFAGCCYGKPTKSVFGVINHFSKIAPNGIPLVPVQLFESAIEIALFCSMLVLQKKRASGMLIQNYYLLLYGAARFFLEYLRADVERGFIGVFSISQIIALATCIYAAGKILRKKQKAEHQPEN